MSAFDPKRTSANELRVANFVGSLIRSGTEDTTIDGATGREGLTTCSETHKIVFDERRPVRRKHPFGAGAHCPASAVIRERANLYTGTIKKGHVGVGPRRATLHIKQEVRCNEVPAPSRQSIEPVCAGGRRKVRCCSDLSRQAYCESQRPT